MPAAAPTRRSPSRARRAPRPRRRARPSRPTSLPARGPCRRGAASARNRVLGGRAHRELVAVRLAGDERARSAEFGHGGGLVGRAVPLEDPGATGRRELEGADVVLHRHRHAVQHARRMRPLGLGEQRLAEILGRREAGIEALGLDEAVGRRLGARERFAGITHDSASSNCPSFGTTKKPSRNAGASLSGPKASGQGFTSSARNRTASGPGTNGFTPSLAGTLLIWAT